MDKQFPVEPFEYESEREDERTRDHRHHRRHHHHHGPLPRAGTVTRSWERKPRFTADRSPGIRYPYIPFPAVIGCSCDEPSTPAPLDPQPAVPPVHDGAPVAGTAPDDQELDAWNGPTRGFRARKRRARAASTDPVHLDGEDAGASTGAVAPSAAPPGLGAGVSTAPPRLGTLRVTAPGRHQFSYTFTPEDLVWTARFLVGEAGGADNVDNAAVIWTMFNRFGLFTHARYGAFHEFLRAYSTPLQSVLHSAGAARRHMHDPTFVTTGGSYPGTSIPRGQLQRFLELQKRPWNQLPRAARALATRALRGGVPDPIGNATEFASTAVYFHDRHGKGAHLDDVTWRNFTRHYASTKRWTWIGDVPGLNQRNNAFFIDHRAAALPLSAVRVSP